MDLLEQRGHHGLRHPWELARLKFVSRILRRVAQPGSSVLDVGCGDGFVLDSVSREFGFTRAVGVDVNLAEDGREDATASPLEFRTGLPSPANADFDLLLLLDVLEHVEHPVAFLTDLVREQLRDGAWALVTVPAFGALFSELDVELKHFRRYRRSLLVNQAQQSGLQIVDSGYFFASLLPARALKVLAERALPKRATTAKAAVGLGAWRGGPLLTSALAQALGADAQLCLALNQLGVRVPGLSAWLLCRYRSEARDQRSTL